LEHTAHKNQISLKLKIVGHSLAKNPIFSVTLTTDDSSDKPNIVVLARQHSGESWSSFLAEKVMQELAEQKSEASKWTLQHYQVCVLPMVNVDGVIYGNFRCDLAGYDLNRCWK
jgi:murein tripeptide amidase MpaA